MEMAADFNFEEHNGFRKNKKTDDRFENKEIFNCDFCGSMARQSIENQKGEIVLACFNCIPRGYRLPWMKSVKPILY